MTHPLLTWRATCNLGLPETQGTGGRGTFNDKWEIVSGTWDNLITVPD